MNGDASSSKAMVEYLIHSTLLAAFYALSYAIVVFVFNPIQALVFPEITHVASLCFLPHGIRVIATAVLGARAIPGLFVGAVFSTHFIWGIQNPEVYLLISVISSGVCWVVFESLRGLKLNAFYLDISKQMPEFHTLLLVGIICSVANSFLMSAVLELTGNIQRITLTMAAYALGDTIGLIVSWMIANSIVGKLSFFKK